MKKLVPKTNQDFLTVVVYVVLGVIAGVMIYYSLIVKTRNAIEEYRNRIEIASGESKRNRAMLEAVTDYNRNKLNIESKTLKFSDLMPHKLDTTEFVRLLENFSTEFSSEYGLKNMRIDIIPLEQIKEGYYKRQFRVYCQGRYADLMNFFDILQKAKYLLNIEELNVRRNPETIPYLEADFRISIIQTSPEE
ncbi:MAG: hypothetical protein PHQ54_03705 [Candidatus Omnitrophica bacterium]|nr:hypothetical protein [Candidatus Omnitrophota bacterium]